MMLVGALAGLHCAAEEEELAREGQTVTVTLQPDAAAGKDARAFSLQPDTPGATTALFYAIAWTFGGERGVARSFLDFSIPAPPPGAPLLRATLTLYADVNSSTDGHSQLSGSNEVLLRQVVGPWEESTLTWNNQPATDASTEMLLAASTSPAQDYEIDVTPYVARELSEPGSFHGFSIQLQTEQFYRSVTFGSSDSANAALRPKLEIEYQSPNAATGTIRGTVTQYRGAAFVPLPGARVEAGRGSAISNSNGDFEIRNLPLGTYTLRASLQGWTFGSREFQEDEHTITIERDGQVVDHRARRIIGYDREPLVFLHGFQDGEGEFNSPRSNLEPSGTLVVSGQLVTSSSYTAPIAVNALLAQAWVREARRMTGQPRVILYGHSMGGVIARAYVEGGNYQGDVSQLFTAGTPHLGTPAIGLLACAWLTQPAACEMSVAGMALFNLLHWKRAGVDYHAIGGDAPMWTHQNKCVRLFGRRFCISIPLPTFEYRDGKYWAAGALIPGADDGFIRTSSSVGQIGANLDRFITQEVHDGDHRDYHFWSDSGRVSAQAFDQCVRPLLIDRTRTTCGTRSFFLGPLLSPLTSSAVAVEPGPTPDGLTTAPRLTHSARMGDGILHAGERLERTIVLEGGVTTFTANWGAGSAAFSLIDPSGLRVDAAYAAAISEPSNDPPAPADAPLPPEAVMHESGATFSVFHVPTARAGTWRLILEGGNDLPAAGTAYQTAARFDGSLAAAMVLEHPWTKPGEGTRLEVQFSEPVQSAVVEVAVIRDGVTSEVIPLPRVDATRYAKTWLAPSEPGYLDLSWSVRGARRNGVLFERAGRESLQIQSTALSLGTGHTDRTAPRVDAPGLNEALITGLHVTSQYGGGRLGVAAELKAADGVVIARTLASADGVVGDNLVELRFDGDEIYRGQHDGPFTIANVRLLDQRGAMLLAGETSVAHITAAYSFRSFARSPGAPTVTLNGPYRVAAGLSIALRADGIDPEGDPLVYRWDLDGDGAFELEGQAVTFTAPLLGPPGTRTIRVTATDSTGAVAEAGSQLEIIVPTVVNLARTAQVTAKSSQPGHPASRINDGTIGNGNGSSASWMNGIADRCQGPGAHDPDCCDSSRDLPTWVELDFAAMRTIRRVEVYLSRSQLVRDYDLQISSGEGWETIEAVVNNTSERRSHAIPERVGTRLRLLLRKGSHSSADLVRINEVEVYGY